jgi:hypothetical protein
MNAVAREYAYDRSDEIRTLEQNKKFHAMVADIARQLEWAGERLDAEDWKRLFLAAKYEQRVVPNPLDPQRGFVVMNVRRSRGLTVPEMAEFIGEIEAFGAERGVQWSDDE